MKKTAKLAFCGILSAFSLVILLAAYFPYLTYALPAIAGTLFSIAVIEIDKKHAFAAYFCTAIICFFICETEAKLLFILFFGYYPILKSTFESFKSRILEYISKFLIFNISITVAYLLIIFVFKIPFEMFDSLGNYIYPIFFVFGNAVFILYDFAISRIIGAYSAVLHKRVKKLFY